MATTNQSAERALAMVEYLAETGAAGLGDIARDLGLNKSTAHRFATTLVKAGYVRQDPADRTYSLTTRVMELATRIMQRLEIHRVVRAVLEELAGTVSETVHLGILDGHDVVYIDKVEGHGAVQMAAKVGSRGASHSTALGKVLLAAQPPEVWGDYVRHRGLPARTDRTIITPEALFAELTRVRARGWAVDDVENEEGIRCVGAPVRDHRGQVVAAISISGWTLSMTKQRVRDLIPLLLEHAGRSSELLGFRPGGADSR